MTTESVVVVVLSVVIKVSLIGAENAKLNKYSRLLVDDHEEDLIDAILMRFIMK